MLHLIGLFLLHDGEDHIRVQLALLGKAPHFDGLGMGWGADFSLHDLQQGGLLGLRQIGQLHGGAQGHLQLAGFFQHRIIHHVQQLRDKVG